MEPLECEGGLSLGDLELNDAVAPVKMRSLSDIEILESLLDEGNRPCSTSMQREHAGMESRDVQDTKRGKTNASNDFMKNQETRIEDDDFLSSKGAKHIPKLNETCINFEKNMEHFERRLSKTIVGDSHLSNRDLTNVLLELENDIKNKNVEFGLQGNDSGLKREDEDHAGAHGEITDGKRDGWQHVIFDVSFAATTAMRKPDHRHSNMDDIALSPVAMEFATEKIDVKKMKKGENDEENDEQLPNSLFDHRSRESLSKSASENSSHDSEGQTLRGYAHGENDTPETNLKRLQTTAQGLVVFSYSNLKKQEYPLSNLQNQDSMELGSGVTEAILNSCIASSESSCEGYQHTEISSSKSHDTSDDKKEENTLIATHNSEINTDDNYLIQNKPLQESVLVDLDLRMSNTESEQARKDDNITQNDIKCHKLKTIFEKNDYPGIKGVSEEHLFNENTDDEQNGEIGAMSAQLDVDNLQRQSSFDTSQAENTKRRPRQELHDNQGHSTLSDKYLDIQEDENSSVPFSDVCESFNVKSLNESANHIKDNDKNTSFTTLNEVMVIETGDISDELEAANASSDPVSCYNPTLDNEIITQENTLGCSISLLKRTTDLAEEPLLQCKKRKLNFETNQLDLTLENTQEARVQCINVDCTSSREYLFSQLNEIAGEELNENVSQCLFSENAIERKEYGKVLYFFEDDDGLESNCSDLEQDYLDDLTLITEGLIAPQKRQQYDIFEQLAHVDTTENDCKGRECFSESNKNWILLETNFTLQDEEIDEIKPEIDQNETKEESVTINSTEIEDVTQDVTRNVTQGITQHVDADDSSQQQKECNHVTQEWEPQQVTESVEQRDTEQSGLQHATDKTEKLVVTQMSEYEHVTLETEKQFITRQEEQQQVTEETEDHHVTLQSELQGEPEKSKEQHHVTDKKEEIHLTQQSKQQEMMADTEKQYVSRESNEQHVTEDLVRQYATQESEQQCIREEQSVTQDLEQQIITNDTEEPCVTQESEQQHLTDDTEEQCVTQDSELQHVMNDTEEQCVTQDSELQYAMDDTEEQCITQELELEHVMGDTDKECVTQDSELQHVMDNTEEQCVTQELELENVTGDTDKECVTQDLELQHVMDDTKEQCVTQELELEHVTGDTEEQCITQELELEHVMGDTDKECVTQDSELQHVMDNTEEQCVTQELELEHVMGDTDKECVTQDSELQHVMDNTEEQCVTQELELEHVTGDADKECVTQELELVTGDTKEECVIQSVTKDTEKSYLTQESEQHDVTEDTEKPYLTQEPEQGVTQRQYVTHEFQEHQNITDSTDEKYLTQEQQHVTDDTKEQYAVEESVKQLITEDTQDHYVTQELKHPNVTDKTEEHCVTQELEHKHVTDDTEKQSVTQVLEQKHVTDDTEDQCGTQGMEEQYVTDETEDQCVTQGMEQKHVTDDTVEQLELQRTILNTEKQCVTQEVEKQRLVEEMKEEHVTQEKDKKRVMEEAEKLHLVTLETRQHDIESNNLDIKESIQNMTNAMLDVELNTLDVVTDVTHDMNLNLTNVTQNDAPVTQDVQQNAIDATLDIKSTTNADITEEEAQNKCNFTQNSELNTSDSSQGIGQSNSHVKLNIRQNTGENSAFETPAEDKSEREDFIQINSEKHENEADKANLDLFEYVTHKDDTSEETMRDDIATIDVTMETVNEIMESIQSTKQQKEVKESRELSKGEMDRDKYGNYNGTHNASGGFLEVVHEEPQVDDSLCDNEELIFDKLEEQLNQTIAELECFAEGQNSQDSISPGTNNGTNRTMKIGKHESANNSITQDKRVYATEEDSEEREKKESEMGMYERRERDEKENRIRSFEMLVHLETIIKELEMYRNEQSRLQESFKMCMDGVMNSLTSMTYAIKMMEKKLNEQIKQAQEELKRSHGNSEANLAVDSCTQIHFDELKQRIRDLEVLFMTLNIREIRERAANHVSAEINGMGKRLRFTESNVSDLELRVTELESECTLLRKITPAESEPPTFELPMNEHFLKYNSRREATREKRGSQTFDV
ncbi:early endosome antigen 1 isoform X3 [Exaiptasia diaphana]|uniref:Uncharacterized protein n=1 Tax=Exaiptasia diaphana TaxID=2652724 RepID=A0A913YIZ7_EXADI|nr:early endosome antigen 1 isoform X3 [Exaiptasia diaphana]